MILLLNNIAFLVIISLCIKIGNFRFFIPIPDSSLHNRFNKLNNTSTKVELDELSLQNKRLQSVRWYNEYNEEDDVPGRIDMKEQVMLKKYYTSILVYKI